MSDSVITPTMRQAVGRAGAPTTAAIERGAIARFAQAIGDPNPAYPDVAPPTFLRSLGGAVPDLPGAEALPRVLDGGSEWTYHASVCPGEVGTAVTPLEALAEREGRLGKMVFATYATGYTNQRGELVATQRSTAIWMGPAS